jgi:uncharacterized protein (DUF58 family)
VVTALLGPLLLAVAAAILAVVVGGTFARRADQRELRGSTATHEGGRWLSDAATGGAHKGLSPEVLAQVQRIHIRTRHQVNELMAGEYTSAFKGRGMEFEEVREYVPGDDVRTIDWNVTARMQTPFVKEFREERELVVMILVDVSRSGDFGTKGRLKNEVAAELAATLAFAATRNNDKVGLILFTDRVERFVPPKKGRGHVWRVIREILDCERQGRGTDLAEALAFLNRVVRRKAVVFLVSDFLSDTEFERPLRIAGRRHDLVVFHISDPRERELPDVGFLALEDAEDGRQAWVDTSSRAVRGRFAAAAKRRDGELKASMRKLGIDIVGLSTDEPVTAPLIRYFSGRLR